MNDWLEGFELKLMPIQEERSAPDARLVCDLHLIGTERRTGLTTDIEFSAAFRFAPDGRLIEIHEYATRREALEAAGLSESAEVLLWTKSSRPASRTVDTRDLSSDEWAPGRLWCPNRT